MRPRFIASALMRRRVWETVGGFPEHLRSAEDLLFMNQVDEANFRIAPLTDVDAEELVTQGKAGRLVGGFRGPALDEAALIDLAHRLGRLGEEQPDVVEVDLNPVIAFTDRCVVVDARVRLRRPSAVAQPKSW